MGLTVSLEGNLTHILIQRFLPTSLLTNPEVLWCVDKLWMIAHPGQWPGGKNAYTQVQKR